MTDQKILDRQLWDAMRFTAVRLRDALEDQKFYTRTERACMEDYVRAVHAVCEKYRVLEVDHGKIKYSD